MINVILNGACGRLGTAFQKVVSSVDDIKIVSGVDARKAVDNAPFPIYDNIKNVSEIADVVVDFSTPSAIDDVLEFCLFNNLKLLVATTGHSEKQLSKIKNAAKKIAVFSSSNLSVGMAVTARLVALAASLLSDFDVNVTETHHKMKLDAPSGTAVMLKSIVRDATNDNRDVSINSIRGGTSVGKHEISFFGNFETLTITHETYCKDVYAEGAVRAVRFLSSVSDGFYSDIPSD